MNCVGQENHRYFINMLLSLSVLLTYGGFLTYILASKTLEDYTMRRSESFHARQHWSIGKTWSRYFELWAWAITLNIGIGGVGMLATLTAPLAWGFFLYHMYLVWAGMTTNESAKWTDFKDDIADGLIFKSEGDASGASNDRSEANNCPFVDWPISSNQRLLRCKNGILPPGLVENKEAAMTDITQSFSNGSPWRRLQDISEVDNLYDLGFWDNLLDALGLRRFVS